MKRSFLNSLKGLPIDEASTLIREEGHELWLIPEGVNAVSLVAYPNTVIVFQDKGKVYSVMPGDKLEIEEEQ